MPDDNVLLEVLESLRERGALGETSLVAAVEHADCFLPALPPSTRRLIDLGSGGGLPGLVLAIRRPDLEIVLTDRRQRRTDLLRLACSRLGVDDHVSVVTDDVHRLAASAEYAGAFDAVTARAFGGPITTLRSALPFIGAGGVIVISEPPSGDDDPTEATLRRWPVAEVAALGLTGSPEQFARVRRFERLQPARPD